MLFFSALWNSNKESSEVLNLARQSAVNSFKKDVLYRRWVAKHGGVYVPITKETPPNPYLTNMPERDILTPSGRRLTLLNPAYMTRQVFEMSNYKGIRSHITSLNPLRPANAPDSWERGALLEFESGKTELSEVVTWQDSPYLRYMHVLKVEQSCLQCHAAQGYKLGDVRGGISSSVPLTSYFEIRDENMSGIIVAHFFIWLLGFLAVISLGASLLRQLKKQEDAEKTLEQAGLEWSAAMDASDDIIYILDLDRHVVRANQAFSRMAGQAVEEIIGTHIKAILHPHGEEHLCQVCLAQTEKRDAIIIMEVDNPDNSTGLPVEITVRIVKNKKGEQISILTTVHDLTSARQVTHKMGEMAEQLKQAQKMESIGTLAGGIAHDFNNILTVILGFSDLALTTVRNHKDQEAEVSLKEVRAAGHRAKELVKQILTFSRHNVQELKPLNVQYIIKEALRLLRSSIPTTIELKQNISTNCLPVLADPTQIHQLVLNLCTNAYQAMRETGGVLTVTLLQLEVAEAAKETGVHLAAGRYVKLTVSDNGPGIAEDVQKRIFEPYFTTKGQEEGTGLGLAVVHGIVASYQGEITVISKIGKGTEFSIYLPVIEAAEFIETPEITAVPPTGNERLLLVDDDERIVAMVRSVLTGLGYKVTAFTSSVETLAVFRESPRNFDILVTDMTMPDLTGADLARRILAIRSDMPIILCTGYSEMIDAEKAKKIGILDYLTKPVSNIEIARAVRAALDKQ